MEQTPEKVVSETMTPAATFAGHPASVWAERLEDCDSWGQYLCVYRVIGQAGMKHVHAALSDKGRHRLRFLKRTDAGTNYTN